MSIFRLEIVTPERIAFSQDVNMVLVPSVLGQLGILPNHAPLFAQLVEGEVEIKKGKEEQFLAIGGGFIEVTPNKTTILVTRAVHADELNEQAILKAKRSAEESLKEKPTGKALESAQALLRSSLVNLKVLQRRRKRISKTPSAPIQD